IANHIPELGFYCTSFTKSVLTGLRTGYLSMPRKMALRVESILRVNCWMATPLMAEIATRWIADGTANHLIEIQRERLGHRHDMVLEVLGDYRLGSYSESLSAWLRIPDHWRLDVLA